MLRLFFGIIVLFFASPAWSKDGAFTGKIALDKTIASFQSENPVPGTLYLLTGAAAAIQLESEDPFLARVEFVEAQWLSEQKLVATKVLLSFSGTDWSAMVVPKKPRTGIETLIYPYRKFQVAAVFERLVQVDGGSVPQFRVVAVPLLF